MKIKNRPEMDSITGGKSIKKKIGALKRKTVPLLVVTLLVTTALCYGEPQSDCPSCIVGYWKMDESSGAIVHDSYGGNHGGVLADGDGNDPEWMTGIVGNALHFAGDADDKVVIGDDPAYHFGTGDFALEAWIKYEGPTDGSVMHPAIMSKRPGPPGSDQSEGFGLYLSYWWGDTPGSLLLRIEDTNYYQSSTPVDDGDWHYVVVQRCQDQIQFYVDEQLDATVTSSKNATTNADLTLGLDESSSLDTEWEGLIDEFTLYNCCLSPETIEIHYKQGVNGLGFSTCTCLYSSSTTMEMLVDPTQWDINDPPVNGWTDINVIPNADANSSVWGGSFPDLPWKFMYFDEAHWVYGNVDWDNPSGGHEYYRIPLTVPVGNGCVNLHFKAYVDDTATFYIAGPGYSTPTLFYTYPASLSMYNHDPAEFTIDIDGQPGPDCLQPGDYTIYIEHWDTQNAIYGLIFTAECVSCPCEPCIGIEKRVVDPTTGEFVDIIEAPVDTEVLFLITVCNCGISDLENIKVIEYFPDCLEYVDSGADINIDDISISDNQVEWDFSSSTLQPGDCFDMKVMAEVVSEGDCENCIEVFAESQGESISDEDCAVVIVTPSESCIDITKKVVDPTTGEFVDIIEVPVDTEILFAITVCNCGISDLENIKVVEKFPDCLEYVESNANVTIDATNISGNQVAWDFSSLTLHPGDCFGMKVYAMVVSEGDCENCIEVFAESQGESISDEDCASVDVTGNKTADAAPEGSEESGGQCLGSTLLTGILVLGAIALNRKKN